jgi:hypothetical protein
MSAGGALVVTDAQEALARAWWPPPGTFEDDLSGEPPGPVEERHLSQLAREELDEGPPCRGRLLSCRTQARQLSGRTGPCSEHDVREGATATADDDGTVRAHWGDLARRARSICTHDCPTLAFPLHCNAAGPADNFRAQAPEMFQKLLRGAIAAGATIAVILFNFALIGAFGLAVAIASLISGILFVVLVVVRTRTQEQPVERT